MLDRRRAASTETVKKGSRTAKCGKLAGDTREMQKKHDVRLNYLKQEERSSAGVPLEDDDGRLSFL